jgi:hypothetical protein
MEKIIIGLVGVVVGSILTLAKDLLNLHLNRKERAKYLAIRVTFLLEKYIDECIEVARDDGREAGPDEQGCIQFYTSYPSVTFESIDVDWKSLPIDLMYNILSLPSDIKYAEERISAVAEVGSGPPTYEEETEERRLQHVKLGVIADDISNELRLKYKLPERKRDLAKILNKLKSEIDEIRQKRISKENRNRNRNKIIP